MTWIRAVYDGSDGPWHVKDGETTLCGVHPEDFLLARDVKEHEEPLPDAEMGNCCMGCMRGCMRVAEKRAEEKRRAFAPLERFRATFTGWHPLDGDGATCVAVVPGGFVLSQTTDMNQGEKVPSLVFIPEHSQAFGAGVGGFLGSVATGLLARKADDVVDKGYDEGCPDDEGAA